MKNQKIIIGVLIAAAIIVIAGAVMLMDMNKTEIIIPNEYTLESNESGVETYVNNLSNGYKLEVKEDSNPNGIKKEDMYGSIMKCTVNGTNYIITCYNPVDKSREVAPHQTPLYDVSDIKAHPGVKPVECVYIPEVNQYPDIMVHSSNPYDLKTLKNMNKTGNLNASSIQQYFPPTYTDACKQIKERDEAYVLQRYYGI
ncbi:hypothetical protein TL18_04640 [Methanobrevibacter sp. YE315]|uniref:hypothetical protein n=1 Tax=Methanobrevibacter sp. YE315 TaxID=1609968 RepID=UPI000764D522|nr:hypothetical protein [Methanobrevibacter sp. YE315]AMD17368.1 hypothetical protein TL18_04640 [Methanobrevibacter sp. YE315]